MTLTSDSPASITASRALSLAFGQGGGSELSLSAAIVAHGQPFTLTGAGFGTSVEDQGGTPVTRHQLWAHGASEIYEDDTQNTAWAGATEGSVLPATGSAFGGAAAVEVSGKVRHANINESFRGGGKNDPEPSILTDASVLEGLGYGEKFYACWHLFSSVQPGRTRKYGYTSLAGVFDVASNTADAIYERGEAVTVTLPGGATESGYILFIDSANGHVWIEHESSGTVGSGVDGAAVSGNISGASLTLDYATFYGGSAGSNKIFRAHEEDGTSNSPNPEFSHWVNKSLRQGAIGGYDNAGSRVYAEGTIYLPSEFSEEMAANNVWQKVEFWSDASADPVRLGFRIGAAEKTWTMSRSSFKSIANNLGLKNWGIEISGGSLEGTFFNELYASNSIKRLEVGDAPTYASCSQLEIQRMKVSSLADNVVEGWFNQGAFDSLAGKYIYFISNETSDAFPKGVPVNPDAGVVIQ